MYSNFIVEPLAPIVTVLAVLLFTLITFDRWTTAVLSVGGIVLYAASWPTVSAWGVWPWACSFGPSASSPGSRESSDCSLGHPTAKAVTA